MKKRTFWLGVAGILIVFAILPITVLRVQNGPREEPEYIRRVWGEHTVGQTFRTNYPIHKIDILVRSKSSQTHTLEAINEKGAVIASKDITTSDTDTWEHLELARSIPKGEHMITFRAPSIRSQEESIDIRYQVDSEYYASGNMVVDQEDSYGDIAFRIYERAPFWKAVLVRGQITDKSSVTALKQVIVGLILAAVIVALTFRTSNKRVGVAIALLVIFVFALRLPYTHQIEGVFGGDAFNYYSKANTVVMGNDPFAADPRKGPLYSFLLIPGLWQRDPLLWSRWVGIAATAIATVFTVLVARRLKFSWALALGAGLLLAVSPEFIWEAPNGLANGLYAALIIMSCWAYVQYVSTDRKKWIYYLAAFLGLTALTRYEGVLVAAVLLPAALLHKREEWKAVGKATLLAGVIMTIPLISYVWSGVSGIRTIGDLQSDSGLFIISSYEGLEENLSRAQGFFAGMWLQFEKLQPVMESYILGMVLAAVGAGVVQTYKDKQSSLRGIALSLILGSVVVLMAMKNPLIGRNTLIAYAMIAAGAGTVLLLFKQPKKTIPLFLVIVLQVCIIIFILPKSRYFLPTLPFLAIAMVVPLQVLVGYGKNKVKEVVAVVLICIFASHVMYTGFKTLSRRVEMYNTRASTKAVLLDALLLLRGDHGRVAYLGNTAEQPVFIYIPENRRFPFKPQDPGTVDEETTFLKNSKIRYILARESELPRWSSLDRYPDAFERAHLFESIYGEDKVFIYKIYSEELPD